MDNSVFDGSVFDATIFGYGDDETSTELVKLSEVDSTKEIEWLIPNWLPKENITIFGGDGGVGKTMVWCNIVASLSAGKSCFFEDQSIERDPKKILILSSEDDLEIVLSKRLKANNANMENIFSIPYTNEFFQRIKFNSEELDSIIRTNDLDLAVFDPLQSFVPPEINMSYRNQMRDCLNPLITLGTQTGCTFLIVMHTNKKGNVSGRARFADSSDIYDIARSALIMGRSKQGSLYLDHTKNNYGPQNKTVLFDLDGMVPTFKGTTDKKDYDFISEKVIKKSSPSKEKAKELILETLKQHDKIEQKDLISMLEENEVSSRTARRAIEELSNGHLIKRTNEGQGDKNGVKRFISMG